MKLPNITPGRWVGGLQDESMWEVCGDGYVIARVYRSWIIGPPKEEGEANLMAIRALPDLLAQAAWAYEMLEGLLTDSEREPLLAALIKAGATE